MRRKYSMKISHEVPISLLNESIKFNDYDYALVHLFETHPEYYQFYTQSIEMGRTVILDNSVFELGEAFNFHRFAHWIRELKPTEYIIPDQLDNAFGTISNAYEWVDTYTNLPGKSIGVIQGTNIDEAIECYHELKGIVDKIAVNFNSAIYDPIIDFDDNGKPIKKSSKFDDPKEVHWRMCVEGRQQLMDKFADLNPTKPFHLLGCSKMHEFSYYKDKRFEFIESVDTSNPIVFALENIKCDETGRLNKMDKKLIDYIDQPLDEINVPLIYENVGIFKRFIP